jgi:hypothetical protein
MPGEFAAVGPPGKTGCPCLPRGKKRRRPRSKKPKGGGGVVVDPVERDIAATYEVGCVLEELLRCVDALDEIAPLDEQHCRPCQERRADAWCECDDAADQGWGDVCAACVLDERWCVACAAISAARVALLFRTRGVRRLRATARKHAKESVYAGHPWRSPALPSVYASVVCRCDCCGADPPEQWDRPCPDLQCCWSPICCALHRWPEERIARARSWAEGGGDQGDDY